MDHVGQFQLFVVIDDIELRSRGFCKLESEAASVAVSKEVCLGCHDRTPSVVFAYSVGHSTWSTGRRGSVGLT